MKRQISMMAAALLLSACNSTENVLKVEGADKAATDIAQTSPVPPAPPAQTAPAGETSVASLSAIRLRFAPIIGAPVDKVTPMSRQLNARAKGSGISIVASADATATHVLKGYFSVLGEGPTTTVIYVFDVLDPSGNRLHRIQGQEVAQGSNAADPWAAVPPALMEKIADRAMTEFMSWSVRPA